MSTPQFSAQELDALNTRFAVADPADTIRWAAERFNDRLIMTSSFGAESMCSIHMATQAKPDIKIVLVNTGYLFPETITFMEQMRRRFNLNIWEFHTHNDPIVWLTVHGEPDPRVRQDVPACCAANKNEVFDRAMRELAPQGWIRGIRADQTKDRAATQPIQWSTRSNCYAISPILKWTGREIFRYMKQHDLPFHPLWDRGYTSIGCNPATCTCPSADGDQRSGRWAGTAKDECGINLDQGAGI